tara:strand:- start:853 stop:1614 length:762 start_codon:yes stop_codon:yes gene_type:complete
MNQDQIIKLLQSIKDNETSVTQGAEEVSEMLRRIPFENLGFARVDHHRSLRQGFPEVIYGAGKTPKQVAAIADTIVAKGHALLVTRTDETTFSHVKELVPEAQFNLTAKTISYRKDHRVTGVGTIVIAAAGTSDLTVAEEAKVTAEILGNKVDTLYDVGVAGLHRLLAEQERLRNARAIVAVAGMEGALPSVIGGLVDVPVVAVPTSVGYGTNFGGITALLGMLNSCSSGISVVNIDNGFGAATVASSINHLK